MKTISKRKSALLLSTGMLLIAISLTSTKYLEVPDFAKGTCIGIGIGLLLISLFFRNYKNNK
ncbi:hypothetical protein SAMN04489797_0315 [Winogradskyella sediminis]|uniref:Uncharacterized protein n=1 Tax=Winogradskyella sediminis TaxID=1382466 RepID=A0A1H1MGT7_9FLAO|nr:hypothetical protein SAMN04489797_0315 [Winogradskyella sediminis]